MGLGVRRLAGTGVLTFAAVTLIAGSAGAQTASPSPSPAPTATPGPASAPARALKPTLNCQSDASKGADFNGDGTSDVALAAPFDDLFGNEDVGSLNVVFGAADTGASTSSDVLLSPASGGIPAFKWVFGPGRLFGKGLAAGDFNDDGRTDLAVGAPGMPVNDLVNSGAVFVFYGDRAEGITTRFSQVFHQDRGGMPGGQEAGDSFGWTLAAGDFNGDGTDDLAIGAPGEDIDRTLDAGAVTVVYGKAGARSAGGGLSSTTSTIDPQLFYQSFQGLPGLAERGDMFGLALAPGNFDGDSLGGNTVDDLVIGVPQEDLGSKADAGVVHVVYGSTGGLTGDSQLWYQGVPEVEGSDEPGDLYGCALAAGNFNGDSISSLDVDTPLEDLAIGVPGEDVLKKNQGGVNVIYAMPDGRGLSAEFGPGASRDDEGDQYFLERPGLGGTTETAADNERFGQALNAQNINPIESPGPPTVTDPSWELVVGAPGEDAVGGEIFVIGGVRNDGLRDLPATFYALNQNSTQMHRGGEVGDEFGAGIAFGDYDDDGNIDMVVAAPGDSTCGNFHELAEFLSLGPSLASANSDQVVRAGVGLALFGNGQKIAPGNGPQFPSQPGFGNSSLTRCDFPDGDFYGLKGDPQSDAELTHTVAGL